MTDDLYTFDSAAASETERQAIELSLQSIAEQIVSGKLSERQAYILIDAFFSSPPGKYPELAVVDPDTRGEFNLEEEIYNQVAMLKRMRKKLTLEDGSIDSKISYKEIKEVVSSCSTVMGTLMKYHKDAKTIQRNRAVEQATIHAIESMAERYGDENIAQEFLEKLKEQLEQL